MKMPFGHAWLDEFPLDRDGIYLNHGTVGVTPRAVLKVRADLLEAMERHPARFMLRELMRLDASTAATPASGRPRLRDAAARVAAFVGCDADGLVFVDNATSGICAVLRSLRLEPGDEILVPDLAYGGVARAAAFIAQASGARVTTFALPFPHATQDGVVAAVAAALTSRTKVALLDHVTSESALVLPLAAMAAACRARGVAVLVDGAHAPGAIALDIASLGVDWYAANLHKWAFAPRACGVLWAAPARRAGLHPAVISWGVTGDDWLAEFGWTGTRDPTPWLAAPAGIAFIEERLGVDAMRRHNHQLAWEGARSLAAAWDRSFDTPEDLVGCMVSVPLPERLGAGTPANAQRVRDTLLFGHGIEVAVIARADLLWARISIQVYNQRSDLDRLEEAVAAIDRHRRQSRISRPVSLRNTSSRLAGRCR